MSQRTLVLASAHNLNERARLAAAPRVRLAAAPRLESPTLLALTLLAAAPRLESPTMLALALLAAALTLFVGFPGCIIIVRI